MRILSTKVHGILDYLLSLTLLAYPLITGFNSPDMLISAIAGTGIGLYSIMTQYETGIIKKISIYSHIMFDVCSGIFLVLCPWVFGFSGQGAVFYIISGSVLLIYTAITDSKSYYRRYVLHPGMYTF